MGGRGGAEREERGGKGREGEGRGEDGDVPWLVCVEVEDAKGSEVEIVGSFA